jgi:GNAT superfamily N-acetyltransferase
MEFVPLTKVTMVREHLAGLPVCPLSEPFRLRCYEPGDGATWLRIVRAADSWLAIPDDAFERTFGADETALAQRQLFLCDADGQAVGTVSAWFGANPWGRRCGRIHWLAILPGFQGRGLAKPLLAAACHRLADLGHSEVYLITEAARVVAIRLYLKFGFVPAIRTARDWAAWRAVNESGVAVVLPDRPTAP